MNNSKDKLAVFLIAFGGVLILGSWAIPRRRMRIIVAFTGTVLAAIGTGIAFTG